MINYNTPYALQEVRSMLRARKSGVLTPCIFFVQHDAATIFMERIEGQSVRDILLSGNLAPAGMPAPSFLQPYPALCRSSCAASMRQLKHCQEVSAGLVMF